MAARDESLCHLGALPEVCAYKHVAALVPPGREGDKSNRACPCHDDCKASLSINYGRHGQRIVWHCKTGCSAEDVRGALLGLGIDESCLGFYGLPKRVLVPGMRVMTADLAVIADAKRYQAIRRLPASLNGNASLRLMCEQAIDEGDGDLPGDPYRLLPVNRDDFLALAIRSGIERGYAYRVYKQWTAYG